MLLSLSIKTSVMILVLSTYFQFQFGQQCSPLIHNSIISGEHFAPVSPLSPTGESALVKVCPTFTRNKCDSRNFIFYTWVYYHFILGEEIFSDLVGSFLLFGWTRVFIFSTYNNIENAFILPYIIYMHTFNILSPHTIVSTCISTLLSCR